MVTLFMVVSSTWVAMRLLLFVDHLQWMSRNTKMGPPYSAIRDRCRAVQAKEMFGE